MNSAPTIDFLFQLTGTRFNPTGIVTPLTEQALEMAQDVGLEFMAYGITDANGYKLSRADLDDFIEYAEITQVFALYHPEHGVALLEAV